jgi:hypothetical protein
MSMQMWACHCSSVIFKVLCNLLLISEYKLVDQTRRRTQIQMKIFMTFLWKIIGLKMHKEILDNIFQDKVFYIQ